MTAKETSMTTRIDRNRAQELGKTDEQFATELVQLFVADSAIQISRLTVAASSADWNLAARIAHTLRGAALSVGAVAVAERCAHLENGVKAPVPAITESQLVELEHEVHLSGQELARVIAESCR